MSGASPRSRTVAIIGAGAAGLTCARVLKEQGYSPTIFEKSRGLGGRLATRRADGGVAFDHGVQYVTAKSAVFRDFMRSSIAEGAAALWHPQRAEKTSRDQQDWFVGTPTMNTFLKTGTDGIEIRLQTEIKSIERQGNGWGVRAGNDDLVERFDIVVATAPAPQAKALLSSERWVDEALGDVTIAPCWALMIACSSPIDTGFDVLSSDERDLAWIARNTSKPQRTAAVDCWTIHASDAWSERHLECEREDIARMMMEMLPREFTDHSAGVSYAAAQRWRYAKTSKPLGDPFLSSEDGTLFVGGDWCLGARVECAFESGFAVANAVSKSGN